jgi:hypothetical protein
MKDDKAEKVNFTGLTKLEKYQMNLEIGNEYLVTHLEKMVKRASDLHKMMDKYLKEFKEYKEDVSGITKEDIFHWALNCAENTKFDIGEGALLLGRYMRAKALLEGVK